MPCISFRIWKFDKNLKFNIDLQLHRNLLRSRVRQLVTYFFNESLNSVSLATQISKQRKPEQVNCGIRTHKQISINFLRAIQKWQMFFFAILAAMGHGTDHRSLHRECDDGILRARGERGRRRVNGWLHWCARCWWLWIYRLESILCRCRWRWTVGHRHKIQFETIISEYEFDWLKR